MPERSVRVIRVPLEIDEEGIPPDSLVRICRELKDYVLKVRLPKVLHGVSLWVEPLIQFKEGVLRLSLLLIHDGQLPLDFSARVNISPDIAITNELDNLASKFEEAIEASNGVWDLAAEIANHDKDPGNEVERLRWVSGYPAPSRPRAASVPDVLQIMTRQGTLVLETPETAPEYLESERLRVSLAPRACEGALVGTVESHEPLNEEHAFVTRVREGHQLRMRWPDPNSYPWRMMATLAALVELPLDLAGHGVISLNTLEGKAFQVDEIRNSQAILDRLHQIIAPVLSMDIKDVAQ